MPDDPTTMGDWAPDVPVPADWPYRSVSSTARPVGTRPVGTRPVGTRPVGTRPVGTRPVGTRPVGTRPVGTRPAGGLDPEEWSADVSDLFRSKSAILQL